MLGPVELAPLDSARVMEPHLVNESCAVAVPDPTVTVYSRAVKLPFSEPEKVHV